jgi:hypothetical protein
MTKRLAAKTAATVIVLLQARLAIAAGLASQRTDPKAQLDQLITSRVHDALAHPGTNDQGNIAWGEAYTLQALAEMLDHTRDPRYADLFVKLGDWVLFARDDRHGRRDEFRGRVVPAWSSTSYTSGKRYTWAVHTGMIAAPLARFTAIVRRNPALAGRYAKDADRFLKSAEESVAVHDDQYRTGPGSDEGYLYGLSLGGNLPLNMQNALAIAWISLDDATGTTRHRERTARLARFFRNRLRQTENGAYVWAYRPPLDKPDTSFEDISHAAINVAFATVCFEHRIVFTQEDLGRLERTLLTRVLRSEDTAANNVGGTGGTGKYPNAVLRWGCLAKHSAAVRERLVRFYDSGTIAETNVNPLGLAYLISAGVPVAATHPASKEADGRP